MKTRRILGFLGAAAIATVLLAGPALAQIDVPGSCITGQAGFGDLALVDIDTCAGGLPLSPCRVKAVAYITGSIFDQGRDTSAEGSCGSSTASEEATVPSPFGGEDGPDTDGPVGPGSPKSGCDIDGAGGFTFWYAYCEFTSA